MLGDAYAGKIPVEGKVVQVIKGGFQVEILKRRAFCPISQMDVVFVEKPEAYVGQSHQFLIKNLPRTVAILSFQDETSWRRNRKKPMKPFYQMWPQIRFIPGVSPG